MPRSPTTTIAWGVAIVGDLVQALDRLPAAARRDRAQHPRDALDHARTPRPCDATGKGGVNGLSSPSPHRHARGHAYAIGHPIVRSFEPGEDWRWCFIDENYV